MSNPNGRRFRELAKHDRIRTGRELAEELEQPFLPLINDCLTDVQRFNAVTDDQFVLISTQQRIISCLGSQI